MDHTKADINRLEQKVATLTRDLDRVTSLLSGKSSQIVVVPTGIEGWGDQIKVIGSRMGRVTLEASGFDHQWKTTESASSTTAAYKVDVKGGSFSTQGGFNTGTGAGFVVADVTELTAGVGFILLHIVRDSSTREASLPAIEFNAESLVSTYSDQYVELAVITEVDKEKVILPLEFGPINVLEDMFVVNGEFKLASLIISGMNYYDLPT